MASTSRELTVARRGIGIDVGSSSVKVAVVARTLGGLVLQQVVEQPIPRSQPGRPPTEAAAAAVAAAMEEVRVGRALVVAGAPTQLSTVRNLDVPFKDEGKIRQVVKSEAEPHLPFSVEDVVVDYCRTGVDKTVPTEEGEPPAPITNLLITVAQKKVVGDLLGVVRGEAFDPEVVDVEFMGAFSAVRTLAHDVAAGGTLIVDFGATKTSVIYARDGRPLAVRAFNFGGDALTQALAEATGVAFDAAEEEKRTTGRLPSGEGEPDRPAQALEGALDGLRRGLDQTLRFPAGQVGEVAYDRVILTGGSAALEGLSDWIASALSTEVTVLDSLGAVKSVVSGEVPVARFATAIGFALRGVGECVTLHNFRQEELAYPNQLKRLVKYLVPAGALVVGLVVAMLVAYYTSYLSTRAKAREYKDKTAREIHAVLGPGELYPTLDALKRKVDERAAERDSLSGENPQSVLAVLLDLSKICFRHQLPPAPGSTDASPGPAGGSSGTAPPESPVVKRSAPWKIQVRSFEMERGRIIIDGTAANYTAVTRLKHELEKSPLFRRVDSLGSSQVGDRVTFKMRMYLKEQ